MKQIVAIFRVVYVGIAGTMESGASLEHRRFVASWALSMWCFSIVMALVVEIDRAFSVDVLFLLSWLWPWNSAEYGRLRAVPVVLLVFVPTMYFWNRVGASWTRYFPRVSTGLLSNIVVFVWFLLVTAGCMILIIDYGPRWAIAFQIAALLALYLWFARRGRKKDGPNISLKRTDQSLRD